jgi:hypothetical protein
LAEDTTTTTTARKKNLQAQEKSFSLSYLHDDDKLERSLFPFPHKKRERTNELLGEQRLPYILVTAGGR